MSSLIPDVLSGPERGTKPRWFGLDDADGHDGRDAWVNVGSTERAVSSLAGGAMLASAAAVALRHPRSGAAWLSGLALASAGGALLYRGATGHCNLYGAVGVTGDDASRGSTPWTRSIHVVRSVTINKSAPELYAFWRDFRNLPRFTEHLERVDDLGDGRSRWVAKAPPGTPGATDGTVEWNARITEDRPNELIAWATEDNDVVEHAGRVEFRPLGHGRGTVVRVSFDYAPVGGALGALAAKLLGEEPGQQVKADLRRLKAHLEAGEIPTTQGQPRGTCS